MSHLPTEPRARRVWFVSPAWATVIFFAVQILLSVWGAQPSTGVAGLAPRAPQAHRGERVIHVIEPADPVERTVPADDAEVLRLLEGHRTVRFRVTP